MRGCLHILNAMAYVLVIDTASEEYAWLTEALEGRDVEVEWIASGNAGLKKARSQVPDLVILGVELERVSGYAICNKFKKDKALKSVPLFLVSGQATDADFARMKAHGFLGQAMEHLDEAGDLASRDALQLLHRLFSEEASS